MAGKKKSIADRIGFPKNPKESMSYGSKKKKSKKGKKS